jgi:predicted nucleic acid-binding protein
VRFWDTSAIVPLLVGERASAAVLAALADDPQVVAWWGTETECVSAIARLERDGALESAGATAALRRLDALAATWHEVQPVPVLRRTSIRLLRVHPLRAADALQLAAATVVAEGHPATLPFVTLDLRLAEAAEREGFPVITPVVDA